MMTRVHEQAVAVMGTVFGVASGLALAAYEVASLIH
jgi:hypothetical protein